MQLIQRKIEVTPKTAVSSVWAVPKSYPKNNSKAMLIAHGAGNDMHSSFISYLHESLAERGIMTVKFNFPYKESGRKAPDRAPVLEATWRAVIDTVRHDSNLNPKYLFLSGKSLGGRMASHVVAEGEKCSGLVFLGYPLHPPNKRGNPRTEHFPQITCPMLFLQGSRDALCDLELLRGALQPLKGSITLHVIEGGDHSFKVLKRLRRDERSVWDEISVVTNDWIDNIAT